VVVHVRRVHIGELFLAKPALHTDSTVFRRGLAGAIEIPYNRLLLPTLRSRTELFTVLVEDDGGISNLPIQRLRFEGDIMGCLKILRTDNGIVRHNKVKAKYATKGRTVAVDGNSRQYATNGSGAQQQAHGTNMQQQTTGRIGQPAAHDTKRNQYYQQATVDGSKYRTVAAKYGWRSLQ